MPTFIVHTPVGVNQIGSAQPFVRLSRKPQSAANCAPIRWIRSPGKNTGNNLGHETPVIHFEQWEQDDIEVKLLLKGGGCENKNIQYSLPCELEHLGRADRDLAGVRKCILHAVWQAQGQGCAPGAIGVCIGSDRGHGYALAKVSVVPLAGRREPGSGTGGTGSADHAGSEHAGCGCDGLRRQCVADRLQDHRRQPLAGQFLRFGGLRLLGVPPAGRAPGCERRARSPKWLYRDPEPPLDRMARTEGFPLTGREIVLTPPITEEQVRALKVGDVVLLSGEMFTGRDNVHAYLMKNAPPVDLNGARSITAVR
jgi:fumarate hydratase, class I